MLRFLLLIACLAVPVFSYSAGASDIICSNDLTPEHHVEPQISPVPYEFSGGNTVHSGENISITLRGDVFLGFAVQARSGNQPIGKFKIVESNKSQTLKCLSDDDTLTHVKIPRDHPITQVKFEWIAPSDYWGKVQFVGTVVKDGGTYWVRKVLKEVEVYQWVYRYSLHHKTYYKLRYA